jgi:hypothetical protein
VLRLEQEVTAEKPNITFSYYGLPPHGDAWHRDPEVQQRVIKSIPLAIVYYDDEYLGGLAANHLGRPETGLRNLLAIRRE